MIRKQRYSLDSDDLLNEALFTPANSDALVKGVSENGTRQFSVPRGGTNNDLFDDQKFVLYDADGEKLQSSPIGPAEIADLVISAGSGFYTGAVTTSTGTDHSTALAASPAIVSSLAVNLPADARWVWARVVFTTVLDVGNTAGQGIDGFTLRLGDDVDPPDGWVFTSSGPYTVADATDTYQVVWMGEGPIPASRKFDSVLTCNIFAAQAGAGGVDVPTTRDGYAVVYYKGASAAEPVTPHGIPTFITPVSVPLTVGLLAGNYRPVDITASVPATATAIILQATWALNSPDSFATIPTIYIHKDDNFSGPFYIIAFGAAAGSGDAIAGTNQGIFPFSSSGGSRFFYYYYNFAFNNGATLSIIGYIS